jgi:hypothetical protein
MSRARRITVTIDRLVLRGFAPAQRDAIASALQAELARQLAEPGQGFGPSRSLAAVRAELMRPASARPQQVGAGAAQQLARSIRS